MSQSHIRMELSSLGCRSDRKIIRSGFETLVASLTGHETGPERERESTQKKATSPDSGLGQELCLLNQVNYLVPPASPSLSPSTTSNSAEK